MVTIVYDGTYQGWLTAVFEIHEYKLENPLFARDPSNAPSLFGATHEVFTDQAKADRILKGLKSRLTEEGLRRVYRTFLSEVDRSEDILWQYVKYVFASEINVEGDLTNPVVWNIRLAARSVKREAHRMKAFVRFKLTKDQLYYAIVEPESNVLPLISGHFKSRYADQRWLIYDGKRKYGIYYDLQEVSIVEIQFNHGPASSALIAEISDEREEFFQNLWRRYFSSVNIKARKNMKLHLQHMPKKYWRHLTEKMHET